MTLAHSRLAWVQHDFAQRQTWCNIDAILASLDNGTTGITEKAGLCRVKGPDLFCVFSDALAHCLCLMDANFTTDPCALQTYLTGHASVETPLATTYLDRAHSCPAPNVHKVMYAAP
jgi:hypothetical protein